MSASTVIREQGVVAIVRTATAEAAAADVGTIVRAGLRAVEVSLVTPDAIEVIRDAARLAPAGVEIGVGTALSAADVTRAVDAGATFIVAPTLREDVIRTAIEAGVAVLPGAATPTEAMQAHEWGAEFAKIFPASLWSPAVLKDLLAALPQLQAVPTGGVTIDNAAAWIRSGAVALGVGSAITKAPEPGGFAQRLLDTVDRARRGAS